MIYTYLLYVEIYNTKIRKNDFNKILIQGYNKSLKQIELIQKGLKYTEN